MEESGNARLSEDEQDEVQGHVPMRAPVVYEVVRRQGEEELVRPIVSLWWSGIAAGIGMFASLTAKGLLHGALPDTPWRPLVANFGYSIGFLIVMLGRLQLFTENTITAVLPLLAHWSRSNIACVARLWSVVFAANLLGTLLTAAVTLAVLSPPAHLAAFIEVSHEFAALSAAECLWRGIPAGFFVALIVWMLPSARGSEFLVIVVLTWLIGVGGYAHVIVGSAEAFLLLLAGEIGLLKAVGGLILPSLVGNVIGGTVLFALLAYAQVREEM